VPAEFVRWQCTFITDTNSAVEMLAVSFNCVTGIFPVHSKLVRAIVAQNDCMF